MSDDDNFVPNDCSKTFNDIMKEEEKHFNSIVEKTDYETKMAITFWVFKNIVENSKESGSYRKLIYDKLGFGTDAYCSLYIAGGMEITNELDLARNMTNAKTAL